MKRRRFTSEEADCELAGIHVVSDDFKVILARALSSIPKEIAEWAKKSLFFFSDVDDPIAFYLSRKDWKNRIGFVFLSNALKKKPLEKRTFTVVHEIAHAKLNHRSYLFNPTMTKLDYIRRETEANILAKKWLALASAHMRKAGNEAANL